jgi:chaperone modulatory protein CbpM
MIEYFTHDQAIAAVAGLSKSRLASFQAADLIQPTPTTSGQVWTTVDLARLALLCDLADHFDLEGDALGVVIGLIDQLHDTRQRLFAMAQAIEDEPQDLRRRVGTRFLGILAV